MDTARPLSWKVERLAKRPAKASPRNGAHRRSGVWKGAPELSSREGTALGDRMSHRVLIVDDEKNIRMTLSRALDLEGFKVETADDGKSAHTAFDSFAPEIVLLDLKLPDTTGLDVLEALEVERPGAAIVGSARGGPRRLRLPPARAFGVRTAAHALKGRFVSAQPSRVPRTKPLGSACHCQLFRGM